MKYGICLTPIYPAAINDITVMSQVIEKTKNQKVFNCAEIYFEGSKEEENTIRKMSEDTGLDTVYLGGLPIKRDGIDISSGDEAERKKSVDKCKGHIDHAVRMGCVRIVVASGPDWKGDKDKKCIAEQMRKSLEELDIYCRGSRLEVSVEPFPVRTDPYLAVGETKLVQDIFKDSSFRNVGITFDTSHFSQLGEDIEESFQSLKPWIHHMHLANCVMRDKISPLYGDKHPAFSRKDGDFSIETIHDFYQRMKSKGELKEVDICSLEIVSRGNENRYYDEACREAKMIWEL